jgi:hypothetical protein
MPCLAACLAGLIARALVVTPGMGAAVVRVAAVVPVVLMVLFIGLLWLLGLVCGRDRRRYVTQISQQAMVTVGVLLHGPAAVRPARVRGSQQARPGR